MFAREAEPVRPFIAKWDEFLPLDGHQEKANFWADGTLTDYKLKTVSTGDRVTFQAISNEKVVDEESYIVRDGSILLARAAGEDFIEPVTLLKFPLSLGDQYDWQGKIVCNQEKIDCTAKVTTSTDFVTFRFKSQDAVKVEVNLKLNKRVQRKLSFWFVKGMGILKTEIGKNVREPKE